VRRTIVIHVIDGEEGWFNLSATRANIATVCLVNVIPDFVSPRGVPGVDPGPPCRLFIWRHSGDPFGPSAILARVYLSPKLRESARGKACYLRPIRVSRFNTAALIATVVNGPTGKVGWRLGFAALSARRIS
jgi:hypothetical protein